MLAAFIFVAFALALVRGCGEEMTHGTGFEFTVPDDWETVENEGYDGLVERWNGETLSAVGITRHPGASLERFVANRARLLQEGIREGWGTQGARILDVGGLRRVSLGSEKAMRIDVLHAALDLDGSALNFHTREVIAIHQGVAYVVAYKAELREFAEHRGAYQAILDSWHWR